MPRNIAIVASLLLLASSGAWAGDFVPRATAAYAPAGDEAGARSLRMAAASMSEPASAVRTPDTDSAPTVNPPRAAHLGADAVASDAHVLPPSTPAAENDDKAAQDAHKSRASRRWQSLLPGVMK